MPSVLQSASLAREVGEDSNSEGVEDDIGVDKLALTLSIVASSSSLGAATYEHSTGRLCLLEDAPLSGPLLQLEQDLHNLIPTDEEEGERLVDPTANSPYRRGLLQICECHVKSLKISVEEKLILASTR